MLLEPLRCPTTALRRGAIDPRFLVMAFAAALLALCVQRAAWAQDEEKKATAPTQPKPPVAVPAKGKSDKIDLTPIDVGGNDLLTQDGVQLRATFYPGSKGKDSVPVVLLHSYKGDRKEFNTLAPLLQQQGHAVLAPDLRGHGESTNTRMGVKLDATKMPNDQFEQMVYKDMPTLKRFLSQKNDAGELNLSKLCVLGSELGSLVALNWAQYDWTSLTGEVPPMDIRALVLISPPATQCGLSYRQALNNPAVRSRLSVLILVGKEKGGKALDNASRMHKMLKPFHPEPPEKEKLEKLDLFFVDLATRLQGSKMLGVKTLNAERYILQFIELRLVKQTSPEYNWRERKK